MKTKNWVFLLGFSFCWSFFVLCQHNTHQMFSMVFCFLFSLFFTNNCLCILYKHDTIASTSLDGMALDGPMSVTINFDRVERRGSRGKCNGEICSWVIDFNVYSSDTTVERWQTNPLGSARRQTPCQWNCLRSVNGSKKWNYWNHTQRSRLVHCIVNFIEHVKCNILSIKTDDWPVWWVYRNALSSF